MNKLYFGRRRRRNLNMAQRYAEEARWVKQYIASGGCEWMTVKHITDWQDWYGRSEGFNLHAPRCVALRLTREKQA
jgi:hypothetical protein